MKTFLAFTLAMLITAAPAYGARELTDAERSRLVDHAAAAYRVDRAAFETGYAITNARASVKTRSIYVVALVAAQPVDANSAQETLVADISLGGQSMDAQTLAGAQPCAELRNLGIPDVVSDDLSLGTGPCAGGRPARPSPFRLRGILSTRAAWFKAATVDVKRYRACFRAHPNAAPARIAACVEPQSNAYVSASARYEVAITAALRTLSYGPCAEAALKPIRSQVREAGRLERSAVASLYAGQIDRWRRIQKRYGELATEVPELLKAFTRDCTR